MENRGLLVDLDRPAAPGLPEIGIGELLRWVPVIEQLIAAVNEALSGQTVNIPLIPVHLKGREVDIGPTPVAVKVNT